MAKETLDTIKSNWKYGMINLPTIDNIISDSILLYGEWAQKELDVLTILSQRRQNPEILMVGSNIGILTIALSKILTEANASIHSFELHPQIRGILLMNIIENKCDNILNHEFGLSSEHREVSLPIFKNDESINLGSFSLHKNYTKTKLTSELRTIDSLELDSCSLIHLDVERHEMSCIKGGIKTIERYRPDLFAEMLSINYCKQFYNYLKSYYDYFYLFCPKAYNPQNYNLEQKNIFGQNREFSMIATNQRIKDHMDLFEIDSIESVSKLYTVFSKKSMPEYINGDHVRNQLERYTVQVYVDSGDGFNENNSIRQVSNSKISLINFDLTGHDNLVAIRIDPDDKECIVKIHNISVSSDLGISTLDNPKMIGCVFSICHYHFFEGNDPQLVYECLDGISGFQELTIEIEYFKLTKDLVATIFYESKRELGVLQELIDSYMNVDDEQILKNSAQDLVLNVVDSQEQIESKILEFKNLFTENLVQHESVFMSRLDKMQSVIYSRLNKLWSDINGDLETVRNVIDSHQLALGELESRLVSEASEQSKRTKREISVKLDRIENLVTQKNKREYFNLKFWSRTFKLVGVLVRSVLNIGVYKEFVYSFREFFVPSNWSRLLLALRAERPSDIIKNSISYLSNKRITSSPTYHKTKNGKIAFYIERLVQRLNFDLLVSGWLVTEHDIISAILVTKEGRELCPLIRIIERADVVKQFKFSNVSLDVGFEEKISLTSNVDDISLKIVFADDEFVEYPLAFTRESREITMVSHINTLLNWTQTPKDYAGINNGEAVFIIIPIYNGYELLKSCIDSVINNSILKYKLVLIDDHSTDSRIEKLLSDVENNSCINSLVIRNKKNLGFIKSINRAYRYIDGNFIILNSDTEVSSGWLSRMLYPLKDQSIASVTPLSNCATIFSFPKQDFDNELYLDLSPGQIDDAMKLVDPNSYIKVPTGVGFCMAINYQTTREIGMFDTIYGKGYAEENDWCCRASERGYVHALATNCFVYHKHGGSFSHETKRIQIEKNLKILNERFNGYNRTIAEWMQNNPLDEFFSLFKILLFAKKSVKTELFIDYTVGGGAALYSNNYIESHRQIESELIIVVDGSKGLDHYSIRFYLDNKIEAIEFYEVEEISLLFNNLDLDIITINNFVGSTSVYEWADFISEMKQRHSCDLNVLIHDFHPICPSYNLLDNKGAFCNVPSDLNICKKCLPSITHTALFGYTDILSWRRAFGKILVKSDIVTCFSKSSAELMSKAYPGLEEKLNIVPHKVLDIETLNVKSIDGAVTVIGILGGINFQKGSEIVIDLCRFIDSNKLKYKIVVIGQLISNNDISELNCLFVTGPYNRSDIGDLTKENDIDVFFIPSIWPETFSYTAEEVMMMKMPLAVFDIGAPFERCKDYGKGLILSYKRRMESEYLLEKFGNMEIV